MYVNSFVIWTAEIISGECCDTGTWLQPWDREHCGSSFSSLATRAQSTAL